MSEGANSGRPQDVDRLVEQLLDRADAEQAGLLGPRGLLTELTQRLLKRAEALGRTRARQQRRGDCLRARAGLPPVYQAGDDLA